MRAERLVDLLTHADRVNPLLIETDRITFFCIIGALQLACRHPDYRERHRGQREVVERFVNQIAQTYPPEVRLMIHQGWDPNFDIQENPS